MKPPTNIYDNIISETKPYKDLLARLTKLECDHDIHTETQYHTESRETRCKNCVAWWHDRDDFVGGQDDK